MNKDKNKDKSKELSKLNEDDYRNAAIKLGVEVATIKAIANVESNGDGFYSNGFPKVRFESHKFREFTNKKYDEIEPELTHPYYEIYDKDKIEIDKNNNKIIHKKGEFKLDKNNNKIVYKQFNKSGYAEVTDRLVKAEKLDKESAYKATSWGKYQIMGFNYKECGYNNVTDFVDVMKKGEKEKLDALVNFINSNEKIKSALQENKWDDFASKYNGFNYKINKYDEKLQKSYEKNSKPSEEVK